MFLRLLFLLLLALNLGAAAWLLFGRLPAPPLSPASDPGVTELRLLTEVHAAPASTPPVAPASAASIRPAAAVASAASTRSAVALVPASATTTSPPAETCATLGAFTTSVDMHAAMQALTPHVARIQYREEQVSHSHGFWVYLPATTTREAALDEAHKLAAKGINDYYVVTAGDSQNTISLGLFDSESNAQNRMAKLQQQGFAAKVRQRVDTEPAYWVDYAVPAGEAFKWQAWLPGRNDLAAKPIDCF